MPEITRKTEGNFNGITEIGETAYWMMVGATLVLEFTTATQELELDSARRWYTRNEPIDNDIPTLPLHSI
jgi:hypothetical protein